LPYKTAGTEVYTWALCKQMQKLGIDVKVVIPHYGNKEPATYIHDGIYVYQYAEPSLVDRSLIMGLRQPDGLMHFEKYINDERPDIIHFHEIVGSNGVTLKHVEVAKKSSAKVIMTFHLAGYSCKTGTLAYLEKSACSGLMDLQKCSICYLHSSGHDKIARTLTSFSTLLHNFSINPTYWQNKAGTALGTVSIISKLKKDLYFLVSQCDYVVCVTDWYKKILLANGVNENKIKIIKQGLPFSHQQVFSVDRILNKRLKLVFLGRINKSKGLHLLIKALNGIDPNLVELSIFGSSDDAVYEYSLKAETDLQTNISWNGNLNQQDVIKTLQQHDILCLCSTLSEMSALVIQEAFAAGIPVLASNVYGNAEQICHNQNGLLYEFNNIKDLRKQILRLINEKNLLQDLSRNIKPPKSFREVCNEYLHLYKNQLN
jgi:glycosyltransferase involved in cell wall biosynthesis